MRQEIEDFIYKKVIRNLLLTSKLGRQSVLGEASTGYNFDHMYVNKAQGIVWLGKVVDFILLHLPAVKATRARKANIIKILSTEIEARKKNGENTRIMDVACGAGRYLAEIEKKFPNIEIIGVDYDFKSIKLGRSIAQSYSISETKLRYFKGNVFQLDHLKKMGKKINWQPHIILASGLIEYLDDQKMKDAFLQIYNGLADQSLFVLFNQQANPSRKLMEKVCTTKDGAWILYYRQPGVVKTELLKVGFKHIQIHTDKWSMYNLLIVRK